jgi:hypothetical protein
MRDEDLALIAKLVLAFAALAAMGFALAQAWE